MEDNIRKCKECGKLFKPKGRENYCSAIHYRPCPICGTPVEAKYLSDPPRRCENCKGKGKKRSTVPVRDVFKTDESTYKCSTVSNLSIPDNGTVDVWKYKGPQIKNNFIPGHIYPISVGKTWSAYAISSKEDITTGDSVDFFMTLSSKISINQYFEKVVTSN